MSRKIICLCMVLLAVAMLSSCDRLEKRRQRRYAIYCHNNLKAVLLAMTMWTTDHDDTLPEVHGWERKLLDGNYLDAKYLVCFGSKMHYKYLGNGQKLSDYKDVKDKTILFICESMHLGKTNAVFLDGHSEALDSNVVKIAVSKAGASGLPRID